MTLTVTDSLGIPVSSNSGLSGTLASLLTVNVGIPATFVLGQAGQTVTATVNNPGAGTYYPPAGGTAVTIALPPGLTPPAPADITASGWTCSVNTGASSIGCTRTDPVSASSSYPAIQALVTVNPSACSGTFSLPVSAFLSLGSGTPSGSAGTASASVYASGCLLIGKSHTGNFQSGGTGVYTITVSNPVPAAIANPVTVQDTLSAGETVDPNGQLGGTGWTCGPPSTDASSKLQTVSCTSSTGVAASGSYPAINLPVAVAASTGCGLLTDVASLSLNNGSINLPQGTKSDPTSVTGTNCLTISGIFTASGLTTSSLASGARLLLDDASASPTAAGIYSINIGNTGQSAVSAPVNVTLQLPAGVVALSPPTGVGWGSCSLGAGGAGPVTCSNSGNLAAGANYSPLVLTVGLTRGCGALPALSASVAANGATQATFAIPASVPGPGCLAVTQTHPATFQNGSTGVYNLTVTNPAGGSTAPAPTAVVQETLPAGLTYSSFTGANWSCSADSTGQTFTCTRPNNDDLAAGASYENLAVAVNVQSAACPSVIGAASLTTGGASTPISVSSDQTPILGCWTLNATPSSSSFVAGGLGSYTFQVNYLGNTVPTGTLELDTVLPPWLSKPTWTAVDGSATDWVCTSTIDTSNNTTVSCTHSPASQPIPQLRLGFTSGASGCFQTTPSGSTLKLNAAPQSTLPITASVVGGCPLQQLTESSSSSLLNPVPGSAVTYTLVVKNLLSTPVATGSTVQVTDTFQAGLTPTGASGTGWICPSQTTGSSVTCTRDSALGASSSYPPLVITLNVDTNACPTAQDQVTVLLAGSPQISPSYQYNLRGCLLVQPPNLTFPTLTVGGASATPQSLTFKSLDVQSLNVTVTAPPTGSPYTLSSSDCPGANGVIPSGQSCTVTLTQTKAMTVSVAYSPACIGTDPLAFNYTTDVGITKPFTGTGSMQLADLSLSNCRTARTWAQRT